MIISVPILWNSDHKSEFCNFTSTFGSVNLGGIAAWKVRGGGTGNIVGYGSANQSKFHQKFGINPKIIFKLIKLCKISSKKNINKRIYVSRDSNWNF